MKKLVLGMVVGMFIAIVITGMIKPLPINEWYEVNDSYSQLNIDDHEFIHVVDKSVNYDVIAIINVKDQGDIIMIKFKQANGRTIIKEFILNVDNEYVAMDKSDEFNFIVNSIHADIYTVN